jgi:hypothetical protein
MGHSARWTYGETAFDSRSVIENQDQSACIGGSAVIGVDGMVRNCALRSMRMGTRVSPWHFDTGDRRAPRPAKRPCAAILCYARRLYIGVEAMNKIVQFVGPASPLSRGH